MKSCWSKPKRAAEIAKEMADPAEQSYDRANEFGWKEGDIDIQEPGTVEPLKIQRESSGDGRSRRGRSGNPASKPKGARHHATRAAEALLDGEAEALTRKAIKLARAGDSIVWRLRILPRRRERPLRFVLPELRSSTDVAAAAAAILAAVASGNACVAEAANSQS